MIDAQIILDDEHHWFNRYDKKFPIDKLRSPSYNDDLTFVWFDPYKEDPCLTVAPNGNRYIKNFVGCRYDTDTQKNVFVDVPAYIEIDTYWTWIAETYKKEGDDRIWYRPKKIHLEEDSPCYPENPNSNVLKDPYGRKHLIEWKDGVEYVDGVPINNTYYADHRMAYDIMAIEPQDPSLGPVTSRLPPLKGSEYAQTVPDLLKQIQKCSQYKEKSDGSFYTLYKDFNPKRALHQFKHQRLVSELIQGEDAMYEEYCRMRDKSLKEKQEADLIWQICEDTKRIEDLPYCNPTDLYCMWRYGEAASSKYYYNHSYAFQVAKFWLNKIDKNLKYTYYEFKCRETLAPQEEKLALAAQLTEKDIKRPKGCYAMDEIAENELKFAKEYVAYEEELKEVKERFKRVKEEYAALGVNTRAVIKSVKKIAKSFKISKTDADDEERLEGAIRGDTNLFSYIEKVMI